MLGGVGTRGLHFMGGRIPSAASRICHHDYHHHVVVVVVVGVVVVVVVVMGRNIESDPVISEYL